MSLSVDDTLMASPYLGTILHRTVLNPFLITVAVVLGGYILFRFSEFNLYMLVLIMN